MIFLETWTLFANEQGDAKESEFPDLLHPNQAGYAKWGAALRPILATLDYLETDDDKFELVVTVKDNVAHCTCNNEVLEAMLALPPTGPIGLEADRGQMEYRRIRIQARP